MLKIYLSGCLDRIPSSRCLERQTQRHIALARLTDRLEQDFLTQPASIAEVSPPRPLHTPPRSSIYDETKQEQRASP
ncbi:hypothetical protein [Methylobacterium sp. J-048]|uniref:hypothetical protein n=1 Tax=Methylobacterium sp. J-048 TaxID=2836635 RepID=UPI003919EC45